MVKSVVLITYQFLSECVRNVFLGVIIVDFYHIFSHTSGDIFIPIIFIRFVYPPVLFWIVYSET